MTAPRNPAVQVLGSAVLLQGAAVADVHYLLSLGVRQATVRDGIAASPRLQALLDAFARAVSMSDVGRADVRDVVSASVSSPIDPLTTREVAQVLGCTTRHVTRIACDLGGHRGPGGQWVFDRGAVEAARQARHEDGAAG